MRRPGTARGLPRPYTEYHQVAREAKRAGNAARPLMVDYAAALTGTAPAHYAHLPAVKSPGYRCPAFLTEASSGSRVGKMPAWWR